MDFGYIKMWKTTDCAILKWIMLIVNKSFVFTDYIISCNIYSLFEPFYEIPTKFVNQKRSLHMFPSNLIVLWLDWHILMKRNHIRANVVVGPTEEEGQKQHHSWVQLRNVTDDVGEEIVDSIIIKHVLVKLSNYFFKLIVASKLLKQSHWHL